VLTQEQAFTIPEDGKEALHTAPGILRLLNTADPALEEA